MMPMNRPLLLCTALVLVPAAASAQAPRAALAHSDASLLAAEDARLYVWRDARWQFVSWQTTPLPDPAPATPEAGK